MGKSLKLGAFCIVLVDVWDEYQAPLDVQIETGTDQPLQLSYTSLLVPTDNGLQQESTAIEKKKIIDTKEVSNA